uniref:ATP synthase subunit a n=1 Tax=Passalidae sp. GENSP01 TaxID=1205571 RepID=A0A0S2MRZ5_9SCAR|nr:ATP synthase F0 subunit 6 [Passalidae sp. GENSP01]
MMANLFSSFDPSTFMLSFNWMSSLLFMIFIPPSYWFTPSRFTLIWTSLMTKFLNEYKIITGNKNFPFSILFISLFSFILINNFLGLFPYIFTSSSHMAFTLIFSLPLWLTFMLFGWIKNSFHMFIHLIPQGTPSILMPFMVCIETISNIIRPGTLAIRLSANMIAGHLLLTLLGSTAMNSSFLPLNLLLITQMLLLTLEITVSMIQAYVFSILSMLYLSEIN